MHTFLTFCTILIKENRLRLLGHLYLFYKEQTTNCSTFMLFLKGRQVEVVMEENACFYDLTYYLYGCSNQSPDADEEERQMIPTLNLLNVSYEVTEYVGPWWKGSCFRQKQKKKVLNDISCQFRSGELTAILGSSGMYYVHCVKQKYSNINYVLTMQTLTIKIHVYRLHSLNKTPIIIK